MRNYRDYFRSALIALLGSAALFASCEKEDPKSSACDITLFSVGPNTWTINGTEITRIYPAGTVEDTLSPSITLSPGATVNPPSGKAQNFFVEQGVVYTVTAEDGVTKKTFTAKAIRTPYSTCDILSFTTDSTEWEISGTNITRDYSPETVEKEQTPTIVLSSGATIDPPSGRSQNFFAEQGVQYTVTAEDSVTKKVYTVRARKAPSPICDILSFSVDNTEWRINGQNIIYEFSPETTAGLLTPVIVVSPGATVYPSPDEAQNFFTDQGVIYTVTAENGIEKKTYTVRATRTLHSGCELLSFNVDGVEWHINGENITYEFPEGTSPNMMLTPTVALSSGASINPLPSMAQNFFVPEGVRYFVTSENGAESRTYIVKATILYPDLLWTYEGGTLTINGYGEMENYIAKGDGEDGTSNAPWFLYHNSVETIVIGEGITAIGDNAFYNFRELTSVTIPNSVQTIGGSAFRSCQSLRLVNIPSSVTTIKDFAFYDCIKFAGIIPNSVSTIGYGAFIHCHGFTSLTIPSLVTTIEEWSFFDCHGLISLTIPASVTTIGDFSFGACYALREVTNHNPRPQDITDFTFQYLNYSNTTLKVPASSVSAYKAAPIWKEFKIEAIQ
jgi:hypothetical protein